MLADLNGKMEPWGFEPQIQPCHGRVIPFHYGPGIAPDCKRLFRRGSILYARRDRCQEALICRRRPRLAAWPGYGTVTSGSAWLDTGAPRSPIATNVRSSPSGRAPRNRFTALTT